MPDHASHVVKHGRCGGRAATALAPELDRSKMYSGLLHSEATRKAKARLPRVVIRRILLQPGSTIEQALLPLYLRRETNAVRKGESIRSGALPIQPKTLTHRLVI